VTRHLEAVVIAVLLLISLAQAPILGAVEPKVAPGPIPTQIATAKKVFIANAGGEQPWFEDAQFGGTADRAYDQFYAAIKTWGRYEIVATPCDADLLFEIQFLCPPALGAANQPGESLAGRPFDPQFRLVIREAKTNSLLWAFSERAQWAILRGNRDKNFDQAEARIVSDVQALTTRADSVAGNVKP
jgi:hypothetical protein